METRARAAATVGRARARTVRDHDRYRYGPEPGRWCWGSGSGCGIIPGGSRHEPAPSAAGVDVTPVDDILTSDPGDLRVLAEAADVHVELILV